MIDRCVLDKQITVGTGAQVGVSDDPTPTQEEPDKLYTGITIVGKQAHVPDGVIIGRNCRIDPNVTPDAFEQQEMRSGATVSRQEMAVQRGTQAEGAHVREDRWRITALT
jgi:glucose-1-phosphate adenylyltransferase